jgi:hypothetical protein
MARSREPKTKDALAQVITGVLNENAVLPQRDYWRTRAALVDAVWQILADVWEDGHADFEYMPNPYRSGETRRRVGK